MSPWDSILTTISGASGGGIVYLLVSRISTPRHRFEKPLSVVAPALLCLGVGIRVDFNPILNLVYGAFILALVAVTLIDFRTKHIPLIVTVPGALSGLALGTYVLPIGFAGSLIGLLFGGGVLIAATLVEAARKREIGGGDWKYSAMIGAFLGWPGIITALVLTGVFGIVGALILRTQGIQSPQALGPWLSVGAVTP